MPLGARARSKELNRLKILGSARALFRDRGFEAATLRDIAKEAGLSTGAVFANFSDKNEIFMRVVEEETARVMTAMIDAHDVSRPLEDRLTHQILTAYTAAQSDVKLILSAFVMNWSRIEPQFSDVAKISDLVRQVIFETMRHARDQKELPEAADIDHAAEMLEDLVFANIRRGFHDGQAAEVTAERLRFQVAIIVAGLKAA